MPKLAQILEQSSGTRQVRVSVYFLFWSLYKTNRFHVAVGLFSNSPKYLIPTLEELLPIVSCPKTESSERKTRKMAFTKSVFTTPSAN